MSHEKQLVNAFASAWNAVAPEHLGGDSALGLLALREVGGDQMAGALNVAGTWSASFAAECRGGATGVIICLPAAASSRCSPTSARAKLPPTS